jgi:hypothetical protein
MDIGAVVTGRTIEDAWQAGLERFRDPGVLWRHESARGVAFDLPCMTLISTEPAPDPIPRRYPYPHLVAESMAWLYGNAREMSLLYRRLSCWDGGGGPHDQTASLTCLLRTQPETRSAVFSFWRPETDPGSAYPPAPVAGSFRLVGGALHLYVVSRSADYWVGVVPDTLVFARLQHDIARSVGFPVGHLSFHMWSAHLYEDEYLANVLPGG